MKDQKDGGMALDQRLLPSEVSTRSLALANRTLQFSACRCGCERIASVVILWMLWTRVMPERRVALSPGRAGCASGPCNRNHEGLFRCRNVKFWFWQQFWRDLWLTWWQCRLGGLSYRGTMTADLCLQWSNGNVNRHTLNFGRMPIMVKVFVLPSLTSAVHLISFAKRKCQYLSTKANHRAVHA